MAKYICLGAVFVAAIVYWVILFKAFSDDDKNNK